MLAAPTTLHVPAQGASPCQNPASTNWYKTLQQLIIYNYSSLERFTLYYFIILSSCQAVTIL